MITYVDGEPLLRLADVRVNVAEGLHLVNIDFAVAPGESIALVAQHGRTTLLRVAAGLRPPDRGAVLYRGVPIEKALADIVNGPSLGFVFETGGLLENQTVFDNVALPLYYHSTAPTDEVARRVEETLTQSGLGGLGSRFPFQITRGQQRLAALARALVTEPTLVYIDDLFRGASDQTWSHFLSAMAVARERFGTAFVSVLAAAEDAPPGIDRLERIQKEMPVTG